MIDIESLDKFIRSAPQVYHFIVSGMLIGMMAHLIIGFSQMYESKPKTFNFIWIVSYSIVLVLFFGKFSNPYHTMLDVFLPMYIVFYVQSVMFFNMRFRFCNFNLKDVMRFKNR